MFDWKHLIVIRLHINVVVSAVNNTTNDIIMLAISLALKDGDGEARRYILCNRLEDAGQVLCVV